MTLFENNTVLKCKGSLKGTMQFYSIAKTTTNYRLL